MDPAPGWEPRVVDLAAYRPREIPPPSPEPAPAPEPAPPGPGAEPSPAAAPPPERRVLPAWDPGIGLLVRHEGGWWVLHRVSASLDAYRERYPITDLEPEIREIRAEDFRTVR